MKDFAAISYPGSISHLSISTVTDSLVNQTTIKCYKTITFISCCLYHGLCLKILAHPCGKVTEM